MTDATVGTIGYGFIGNAVVQLFREHCDVVVYDKAGYSNKPLYDSVKYCDDLESVVSTAEVIFVAVPTPMKETGECHVGFVEGVLQDIQNVALKIKRDLRSFIVVVKSTVTPGFTKRMNELLSIRIVFSPEFLTEANAVEDFKRASRVIIGGDFEDAKVVFKYFEAVWSERISAPTTHPDGQVIILSCDSTVAEMVKLSTNVHLTARVMVANEISLICNKLGIDYDVVSSLTQLDRRIGTSHMLVPGPDGSRGYGGHCFVKDNLNLAFISEQLNCSIDGSSLFRALHKRNSEIRIDRDWELQVGRAVI